MHSISGNWGKKVIVSILLFLSFFSFQEAYSQRVALKTNVLEYCVLSPNLALEARLSRKMSFQLGVSANPISNPIHGYSLMHYRVEPELRYWFNRPMARNFMALSGTAGAYMFQLNDRHLKGDVAAVGLSYGYDLVLGRHWNVEFELGGGVASVNGVDYIGDNNEAGVSHQDSHKFMLVPMRAAISFGYIFE